MPAVLKEWREGSLAMMSENARIRTALLSIHPTAKRPAWHGAPTVLGLLRGVKEELAVWRPHTAMNNIREIGLHVAFWENSVANRLSGESVRMGFEQQKTSWAVRSDSVDAAQWKEEVRSMEAAHERLVRVVAGFDPERLDEPTGPNSKRAAIEYIHGVGEHSLYHGAQIKMLKRLVKEAGG